MDVRPNYQNHLKNYSYKYKKTNRIMENGISELRVYEQDLIKDRHYILYGGRQSGKIENELGRISFKYNYITIKMQLEIDRKNAEIKALKKQNKRLISG